MKTYKHIFFDLDRTLWDFDAAAEVAFEKIYEKHHLKDLGIPSAHDFHTVYHPLNEKLWALYRINAITKEHLRKERFMEPLAHYGIHDPDLADQLSNDYVYFSPRIVRLFPGTMEILEYLHPEYQLHLITNGFQEIQEIKLKESGMGKYFTSMTVSEEIGVKKPSPEIFLYAMQKAKARVEQSIMIGDEMEVDIDGARNIGMDQIYFNPKRIPHEEPSTYEINSLLQIVDIL